MNVSFSVSGIPAVLAAIRAAEGKAVRAAEVVVARYVEIIAREAKGLAPVDSGALRENIRGHLIELGGAVIRGEVISDLPYSATVELGRADMPNYPIQQYLQPAFNDHIPKFYEDLAAALRTALGAS